MPTASEQFLTALRENERAYGLLLTDTQLTKLNTYFALVSKWNPRLHLVAPCSPQQFAVRHVLESLIIIRHLPQKARVADVGSGAGLPIIPCLIVRPDICAILIESSAKKAVFLREVLREIASDQHIKVVAKRFQDVDAAGYEFITCRALDKFGQLLPQMFDWVPAGGTMLLFAGEDLVKKTQSLIEDVRLEKIPNSERRYLVIVRVT